MFPDVDAGSVDVESGSVDESAIIEKYRFGDCKRIGHMLLRP